ncbi:Putative signal transducing protein [Saccharicrinis carchari]|uniref:Signal transducing protein n=1 Tax=Saccharicrinis carchari TaxID=1168039 RepID=A0A521DU73_SACCC|nr:DUF2007-related protein [Saccharicrinis carchari]SMO75132.1 Putative signal transducing protein [Saccharicrinis carchari]
MTTKKPSTPIEIFSGDLYEAEMVKNLLENENIEAFLKDEYIGTIAPWYSAPGGAGSVKVIVLSKYFEKARRIVEAYEMQRHK